MIDEYTGYEAAVPFNPDTDLVEVFRWLKESNERGTQIDFFTVMDVFCLGKRKMRWFI
jgi:hypothetical protein